MVSLTLAFLSAARWMCCCFEAPHWLFPLPGETSPHPAIPLFSLLSGLCSNNPLPQRPSLLPCEKGSDLLRDLPVL